MFNRICNPIGLIIRIFNPKYSLNKMNKANRISEELYFITSTVIDWIDVFTRPRYKHIIVESLSHCQQHKGLKIYAWVLMSNHLHAIVSAGSTYSIAEILRDFKKFTSKRIIAELQADMQESRSKWMLEHFHFAGVNDKKITHYRFWQDGYYPELILSYDFYMQKLNYIHDNPVRQEIVTHQKDYLYSSAIDYAGNKGLLDVIVSD